jgi:type IV secretion system protein VirD4
MTTTRFSLTTVGLVLGTATLGVWGGTQVAADALGHQVGLGPAWFEAAGVPVYKPWRLFQWWYAYDAYAPDVFDRAGLVAASGGIAGIVVAITGSVFRARQGKAATTHGSARWATAREVRRAGLRGGEGVVLGTLRGAYLRHAGPEHVMLFAPTRSGKGVGLVVPTLLSWLGSAVVHDIKGENWSLTAGWRSRFSRCVRFDPTDPASARFNPLLEVRRGENEVRDVQNVADILVDPDGSLERRSHWDKTAHALLTGAILHVLYAEEEKTLARVATLLSDPDRTFERTLDVMLTTNHVGDVASPRPHPVVAQAAMELANKSPNERSGVLSTAMSFLSLYRDPVVAANTSASDFRIADLAEAERPASLYLVVPPSDLSRTKPLVRLILNQIGRRLTEELPDGKDGRHELLLMLDEFPALGRLDFFETALAFLAGYKVRAFLIAQSLNQVSKAYGENNAILDNCHVRVAFATNDERTAKRISDALGTATEMKAQRNYAGHRLAPWLSHVMVSRQETARPLLTPGEVMQLPPDEEIVMTAGTPPIRARKLRYYETDQLSERASEPAPKTSVGRKEASPPHDWFGVTASVDERLTQALLRRREAEKKARPGGGGKDQAPQLPTQAKPKTPTDEHEPNEPDRDAEAPDPPMAKAPAAITRAQGLDRTTDLDLFDR